MPMVLYVIMYMYMNIIVCWTVCIGVVLVHSCPRMPLRMALDL